MGSASGASVPRRPGRAARRAAGTRRGPAKGLSKSGPLDHRTEAEAWSTRRTQGAPPNPCTARAPATELGAVHNQQQLERHDVAECILECPKPLAFDLERDMVSTGRFLIVDDYEIAGAGIVLEAFPEQGSILTDHICGPGGAGAPCRSLNDRG